MKESLMLVPHERENVSYFMSEGMPKTPIIILYSIETGGIVVYLVR